MSGRAEIRAVRRGRRVAEFLGRMRCDRIVRRMAEFLGRMRSDRMVRRMAEFLGRMRCDRMVRRVAECSGRIQSGRAGRVARLAAATVALAAVLAIAFAAPAGAGTFRLSQCNAVDRGGLSPRGYQAELWSVSNGWPAIDCGVGGGSIRFDTVNHRLIHNDLTRAWFALPASMPHTTARVAWLDWRLNPQSQSTNPAYLIVRSSGAVLFEANSGDGTPAGAAMRSNLPAGARSLELIVWCSPVNGPGWCNWPASLLQLRGLTVELEEQGEPSAGAGGALAAAGPHAGVEPLEVTAADGDSGVRRVAASLGGTPVGAIEPAGGCSDDRLPPCPQSLRGTIDVDTRRVPDGPQRLRLVVSDAAGNARTVDTGTVLVRNQPPRVDTPSGPPTSAGPAPGGSGSASGTRRVPFPPNPLAGRGHVPNGSHASERARLTAWLELPMPGGSRYEFVRRRSATVVRGVRVRIRGRLTDQRGRPIGRAALAAVRREPGAPWKPVTGIRTRPDGRFTAFTRIGPSQELRFVYYAFGDSTRGRRSARLQVRVRGR